MPITQLMLGGVIMLVVTNLPIPLLNGYITHRCNFRIVGHLDVFKNGIGMGETQIRETSVKVSKEVNNYRLKVGSC